MKLEIVSPKVREFGEDIETKYKNVKENWIVLAITISTAVNTLGRQGEKQLRKYFKRNNIIQDSVFSMFKRIGEFKQDLLSDQYYKNNLPISYNATYLLFKKFETNEIKKLIDNKKITSGTTIEDVKDMTTHSSSNASTDNLVGLEVKFKSKDKKKVVNQIKNIEDYIKNKYPNLITKNKIS